MYNEGDEVVLHVPNNKEFHGRVAKLISRIGESTRWNVKVEGKNVVVAEEGCFIPNVGVNPIEPRPRRYFERF